MRLLWRRIRVSIVLVVFVALAGCSSTDEASVDHALGDAPTSAAVEPPTSEALGASVVPETTLPPADEGAADGLTTAEPLRPVVEAPTTSRPAAENTSAYISRLSMGSQTIEVTWSESEGVAEYHIHRIPRTSDSEPPIEAMTADNRIHVANSGGRFADQNVDSGAEYWHGVRELSASGDLMAHGWHKTAAIDDEQPPSQVDGVTAVLENGEVLVTWTEPEENYQLHGYRVFRGVDGEPPESIAVTWRLDQRSLIDDEPPTSARVVYEVVAFDFHWNNSLPGGVTIDLS